MKDSSALVNDRFYRLQGAAKDIMNICKGDRLTCENCPIIGGYYGVSLCAIIRTIARHNNEDYE